VKWTDLGIVETLHTAMAVDVVPEAIEAMEVTMVFFTATNGAT
jgi:hypothetical protein